MSWLLILPCYFYFLKDYLKDNFKNVLAEKMRQKLFSFVILYFLEGIYIAFACDCSPFSQMVDRHYLETMVTLLTGSIRSHNSSVGPDCLNGAFRQANNAHGSLQYFMFDSP